MVHRSPLSLFVLVGAVILLERKQAKQSIEVAHG